MRVERGDISFDRDRDDVSEIAVCTVCRERLAAPSIPPLTALMQQHLDLAHYVFVERDGRPFDSVPEEHACTCGRRCWGPDTYVHDKVDMRPMSDYDLEVYDEGAKTGQHRFVERPVIRRLVAEVRRLRAAPGVSMMAGLAEANLNQRGEIARLRSDEWLEKAAEEMAPMMSTCSTEEVAHHTVLAILRKHRDGAKSVDTDPKG